MSSVNVALSASRGEPGRSFLNRVKIGTRIFTGFIAVLVLLGAVAVIGTFGLSGAADSFNSFARITTNAIRVLEIDRNVTGLRRNVALYTASREDAALRRVEELKKG